MKIKKCLLTLGATGLFAVATDAQFTPGKLAVLRSGDNNPSPTWSLSVARQSPAFIDEFDPVTNIVIPTNAMGTNGPIFSVAIPTNDSGNLMAMWFNGHAGSEGQLSRSADNTLLTFTGYAHNINAIPGTPSSAQGLDRGICIIDVNGTNTVVATGQGWYGDLAGQSNPRAAVTDGSNNFWGAGSLVGNLYYQVGSSIQTLDPSVSSTRNVKIINGVLYCALQGGDSSSYAPGIYDFEDFNNHFEALPEGSFAAPANVLIFTAPYTTVDGYDINPAGTVAYTADTVYGIQRYEKSGGSWRPVYAFSIPDNLGDGGNTGCFGLVVDWTSTNHPIVFATTTEGAGGSFTFSNRVIRLDDTNITTAGFVSITNQVTTLATAWSGTTNMVFRGLAFTPDLRPVITDAPVGHSVVAPATVSFTVGATVNYPTTFQWLTNGVPDVGQTAATLNWGATAVTDSGDFVQVVVSNQYGAVTSAPVVLTVNASTTAPMLVSPTVPLSLTNAFGDTITVAATASGTDPLTYKWYQNTGSGAVRVANNSIYSGATNSTLTITDAQLTNSGTYTLVVSNSAGFSSNIVFVESVIALPPVIVNQPVAAESTIGGSATFSTTIFGGGLTAQWYRTNAGASTALTDGTESGGATLSGSLTLTLSISNATAPQDSTGSYFCVIANSGGSITTAPVSLTLIVPPPPSFVGYSNLAQLYTQTFDSLPIPNITANTANPITITQDSNAVAHTAYGAVTYSLSNPFDFAFPIEPSGFIGGLGLSNTMAGWFALGIVQSKLGANFGDQTTGGAISFGAVDATNRALGLISTSTTGTTAFGLKLINESSVTISNIDVSYVAELWHQQASQQTFRFGYWIDPSATAVFTTNGTTFEPLMNAVFPTATVAAYDGTNPTNQINLALTNYFVGSWTPGSALWLVWTIGPNLSGAQGIAIDNFSFAAPYLYPVITNQPVTQGAVVGNSVTFAVGVSNAYSLGYQWQSNGVPITGATSSNYNLASATLADSASYDVIVTNLYGSVTSDVAVLTVSSGAVPVTINTPLVSQTNFVGANATFTVTATGGAPLSYFWSFDGGAIAFDTTNVLVVSNLTLASNGTYSVIVSNSAGAAPASIATLTVLPVPPTISGPSPVTVTLGGTAIFAITNTGGTPPFIYQWRTNTVNLADGTGIVGSTSNLLTLTNVQFAQAGSYTVVVANGGGSVTSSVVTLTVIPPISYVAYTALGQVYTQNFDSLPNPGVASVNTGNPITIGTISYAPASPFDFTTAAPGGFGLSNTMAGWFGSEEIVVGSGTRVGANPGDQTTGGVLSYGANSSLTLSSNRALGLIATSSTGGTAFGVRILNQTGRTLTNFNLSYTSELWRQTTTAKTVTNFYYIDVAGSSPFNTNNITAGLTNLSFAAGTAATGINGPVNSSNNVFTNVPIGTTLVNGAALWLVWEMPSATGSAQGLGIDNLVFSSGPPMLSIQSSLGTSVAVSWPQMFSSFTLQTNNVDVTISADWGNYSGQAPTVSQGINTVTIPVAPTVQYFRLKQ